MRMLLILCLFLGVSTKSSADYMYDFVRISCMKDVNFINIDYSEIHNSAVEQTRPPDFSIWEKSGYYNPGELDYKCKLPRSEYVVSTMQGEWRAKGMCGAAPPIIFSLYRNGELIIKNVVLGDSCLGNPSISKITILDKSTSHFPTEMEICYQENKFGGGKSKEICEWYFQRYDEKKSLLPIDSNFITDVFKQKS